jgi:hypothetical protein
MVGRLPTEAFQADIVGKILVMFWEQVERFLRLENSGLRVCNLILRPADERVQPIDCLKEAIRRLQAMQEEHREEIVELRALQSSATRVRDLVLKGFDKTSPLVASLSSATDLIEGLIDAAATNGGHWGARMALTAALSQFPQLEIELDLGLGAMRT